MKPLTAKQKEWADRFIEYGNGTKAAIETYDCIYTTAKTISTKNRIKPNIVAYIEGKQPVYISKMEKLMHAKSEQVQFQATRDLLDRSGLKPVEKTQSMNVNIDIKLDPKERELKEKYEQELRASLAG